MKEGIYSDLSNESYHNGEGISNSGLGKLLISPYHYWYTYKSGLAEKPDSNALKLGSALHVLALQPEQFELEYYVMPGMDRRRKAGKELYESIIAEHGDKHLLKQSDFAEIKMMADAINKNEVFQKIKSKSQFEKVEHSIYWKDPQYGCLLKCRPDWHNEFLAIDIKTTESAAEEDFWWSVRKYGYHRQAALQLDGLSWAYGKPYKNFLNIVVEKSPPYITASYLLDNDFLMEGRGQYRDALEIYSYCLTNNQWPAYEGSSKIVQLSPTRNK